MEKDMMEFLGMLGISKVPENLPIIDSRIVNESDKVIGEMNDFEKACYLALLTTRERVKKIFEDIVKLNEDVDIKMSTAIVKGQELIDQHDAEVAKARCIENMMNTSVALRCGILGKSATAILAKGGQVVDITKKNEYDEYGLPVKSLMSMMMAIDPVE